MLGHWHTTELREGRFEIVQFQSIRPVVFIRCSQNFKNFEDLIDFRIAHEQRPALDHLSEDAACGPQVDTQTVGFLAK